MPGNLNRRRFLKLSIAGCLAFLPFPAFPGKLLAEELPEGRLSLYSVHTGERLKVTYRNTENGYDCQALEALDHILRCHHTGKATRMDISVIEFMNAIDKSFSGNNDIHVISGYRSPEYNDFLIRQGRGVVRGSMHLAGKAIDFSIPGTELHKLRETALRLGQGGVGYYPDSGFIHVDSGRVRTW